MRKLVHTNFEVIRMNEQEIKKWQCRSDLALEAVEQMVGGVEEPSEEGVTYEEDQIRGLKVY